MVYIPPLRRLSPPELNPTRSPLDPASDPTNKTGLPPPPERLLDDTRAQADGRAVTSAMRNANTPRADQPAKKTVRDPSIEHWTP